MAKDDKATTLRIPVIRAKMLGVNVFRGFCALSTLSEISKADIYDQVNNPTGTQRDLSVSHARDAYLYIKDKDFGFWPEVFLCAREKNILTFKPVTDETDDLGILEIDLDKLNSEKDKIHISRIDGNHRLHFGDGKATGYTKIDKIVSFCLSFDLSKEEEIQLFKDINLNQKAMNTSHLDKIEVRLSAEELLKKRSPDLFIAQKLGSDQKSPLYMKVYEGGKKPIGVVIPLRGLRTGIEYMLSRSTQLPHLVDASAQYVVIRNYFEALKMWQPNAWTNIKEYLLLRGTGLWAACFLGAQVIDRTLLKQKFDSEAMTEILQSGRQWDWSNKGDFKGFSGRGGALEISNRIARFLKDENTISTNQLFQKIMSEE